ncbi:MAG: DUF3108 domain-containing protein [Alphaproteobacteria bacterium]|nr:DUF3108 domain-containing protein [Alphaproteobacteria bacterium]
MKRSIKILLLIAAICLGAGIAIHQFYLNRSAEVVITEAEPAEEISESNDIPETDVDIVADIPEEMPGKGGFRLDFTGTKGGIGIGKMNINFSEDGKGYEIKANGRAAGLLKQFVSDRLQLYSVGEQKSGKMTVRYFSNTTIKDDKKATRKEKIHSFAGAWTYEKLGKPKEVDNKIFDQAIDPLTLLFHIGRALDETGKCNLSHNGFIDETGFSVTVTDKGKTSESGIKSGKKKISEIRCDAVFANRAGKAMKDYPFEHEFAKKKAKKRPSVISIYYSKFGGDNFIPVYIKVRETPIGDVNIKLTKFVKGK